MGIPTDSEIDYYNGRKLKSLEFEEQARARQLVRSGHLRILDGGEVVIRARAETPPNVEYDSCGYPHKVR